MTDEKRMDDAKEEVREMKEARDDNAKRELVMMMQSELDRSRAEAARLEETNAALSMTSAEREETLKFHKSEAHKYWSMVDGLKAENKSLLGRAANAELALGREKEAYGELVQMVQGATQSERLNTVWRMDKLEEIFDGGFIHEFHPCSDCSCPVHEQDTICEWCGRENKKDEVTG